MPLTIASVPFVSAAPTGAPIALAASAASAPPMTSVRNLDTMALP
jgi:hypothetical protein